MVVKSVWIADRIIYMRILMFALCATELIFVVNAENVLIAIRIIVIMRVILVIMITYVARVVKSV